MARRSSRRLRWSVAVALVVALVTVLVVVVVDPWGPSDVAAIGGVPLSARGALPTFSYPPPAGYHVVYRVTAAGQPVQTDELWVERPFDSADITASGPTSGTALLTIVSRIGAQVLEAGNGAAPNLVRVPVGPPGADVRIEPLLGPAVTAGLLLVVGHDSVMGQACTLIRSEASLRAPGPLLALTPGRSYVDTCLDRDGIVLQESTYRNGSLTQQRRAISLQIGAAAGAGGDYAVSAPTTPFNQGGGSFVQLTLASSPPGRSWFPAHVPAGFTHTGRYDVIPSQPQAFSGDASQPPGVSGLPPGLVTELDDAFVNGPDLIVLQQGETAGGSRFQPPTGGQTVDLGALGRGQLLLSAGASAVTAEPGGGSQFVRITGTVPPSVLLDVARSLTVEPPGTLVTIPQSSG